MEATRNDGRSGETDERILENIYYTPSNPASYSGVKRLFNAAKKQIPNITVKQIQNFLARQNVYNKHKLIRRKVKRRKIVLLQVDELWAIDLVVLSGI